MKLYVKLCHLESLYAVLCNGKEGMHTYLYYVLYFNVLEDDLTDNTFWFVAVV